MGESTARAAHSQVVKPPKGQPGRCGCSGCSYSRVPGRSNVIVSVVIPGLHCLWCALQLGERGLNFIRVFMSILQRKESEGQVPPQFSAAWAFASAASLAGTLSTLHAQRSEHRRQSEQGRSVAVRYRGRELDHQSLLPRSP